MSKIEELVRGLCPNGVKFIPLGEIAEFKRGKYLSKSDKDKGSTPIILYGELYTQYGDYIRKIVSTTSKEIASKGTPVAKGDIVLPITSTTKEAQIGKASALEVDGVVYLGGDAIALKHSQYPGYLVHLLNSSWFEVLKMRERSGTTVSHLSPKGLANICIPIPPLELQKEIVNILDKFTQLEAELEAELEARRKQYEYYRNGLLTFGDDVKWITLGKITRIFSSSRVHKNEWTTSGVPFYRSSDVISKFNNVENSRGKAYISNELYETLSAKSGKIKKDDVLITGGGTIGIPYIVPSDEPLCVKDADLLCIQKSERLNSKFLYHFFLTTNFRQYLKNITHDATIAHYTISQIANTSVPLPTVEEQTRIVALLDCFEALTTDISVGLPAELAARRKQYEYYRNKLLTFQELKA